MLQLEVFRDRVLVGVVPIDRDCLVVGRDPSCDVVLGDATVSRRHARLNLEAGGGFLIEDLSRRNGIFVGGKRVERAHLEHGTTVQIGRYALRLCLGGMGLQAPPLPAASEAASRPPTTRLFGGLGPFTPGPAPRTLREPYLVVQADGLEAYIVLDGTEWPIGRATHGELAHFGNTDVPAAALLSRHGRQVRLTALQAGDCVRVNDRRVQTWPLRDGDQVDVGGLRLTFHQR